MTSRAPKCPYCHADAVLVGGSAIYPHRPDLFHKYFWACWPCDAYVGCHPRGHHGREDGTHPLGRLANTDLRKAKQRAHEAFDPLWKGGNGMTRREAYKWLAARLGISFNNCHIGMFDEATCLAVELICKEHRNV